MREVLELTQLHKISGFPVVEGKRVVGIVSGGASTFSPRNSAARLSKHEQTDLEEQALTQSVQAATENLVSFLRAQRKTKPH